ncbi:UDP-glucose/GDP-mannose dehydrogenase family protein [Candidatus Gracilibacteria bacterium]|nr:UDP-glucose/GDP-mannose dehydrogenase family protein [Candidatus Gracilibacteria bacterium]NUJ99029.1 UDP-glucose/GDP-mannose dehydrogenase family protein [Candidatus Gracilibacteria bacterium]
MKIAIFGTGYVGLVSGACFAEIGHEVMCVDVDERKIENLKKGIIPIYEFGLEEIVKNNYAHKRLLFTTDAKLGIEFGDIIFNAVGTPPDKENHNKADLQYVEAVARTFGKYINSYKILVNKSTVPVGTGKICKNIIQEEIEKRKEKKEFDVVSNPEFLREGTAIKDFMLPDRIVCGVETQKAKEYMGNIYKPILRNYSSIVFTDIKSAELIKYASNSFLATKISFINEIANFAEIVGANIEDISKGMGLDKRIGNRFLHAGIGYGGSCFPKDIKALIETGKDYDFDFKIIKATEEVNEKQKTLPIKKYQKYQKNIAGKNIAIWGLTFKPKTDDTREAPSIDIIKELLKEGVAKISCFDKEGANQMKNIFQGEEHIFFFEEDMYEVLENADVLFLLTEWDEFRIADFGKIKEKMIGNIIIDGRNIWEKENIEKYGFIYEGIGK